MLLAALSTSHKIGLGLVGAVFVTFALLSAFVIPRFRADYPGRRGLPAYLAVCVALFISMMFAVFFFGREPSEGKAAEGTTTAATTTAQTTTQATTTQATTQATTTAKQTTTAATTTAAPTTQKVAVSETEFKITLPSSSFKAGSYEFDLKNDGHIGHDLVINGPGVNKEKTPVINAGQTATLKVNLKSGTYELYCSVPGHKQAGMDTKITVS